MGTKNQLFKKLASEKVRWILVVILTLGFGAFSFVGPEIHSEVENTPTLVSDLINTVIFFIFLSALLLPVRPSKKLGINNVLILIGAVALLIRTIQLAVSVAPSIMMGQNIPAVFGIIVLLLLTIYCLLKLRRLFA